MLKNSMFALVTFVSSMAFSECPDLTGDYFTASKWTGLSKVSVKKVGDVYTAITDSRYPFQDISPLLNSVKIGTKTRLTEEKAYGLKSNTAVTVTKFKCKNNKLIVHRVVRAEIPESVEGAEDYAGLLVAAPYAFFGAAKYTDVYEYSLDANQNLIANFKFRGTDNFLKVPIFTDIGSFSQKLLRYTDENLSSYNENGLTVFEQQEDRDMKYMGVIDRGY